MTGVGGPCFFCLITEEKQGKPVSVAGLVLDTSRCIDLAVL
jgi:hypothetical protein